MLAYDDPSKTFAGVRFVLLGFTSADVDKIRLKLLEGGGIDSVNYDNDCTHVVVDKLVYDDPQCVNARKAGKTLVTGLWVDHSYDVGMPVDPTSVMYRPMRDLNGIPGAKSLIVCLTGYQRQDRDDIMTMVGLMGANFSKPLVASKVTHLICYKFEGEKYELAKKMKKIKLVNHRWLEDCLKAWEILPEANYCKSGYELEMEGEAKDSEEETEDIDSKMDERAKHVFSPQNTRADKKSLHPSPAKQEVPRNGLDLSVSKSSANIGSTSKVQSTPGKEINFDKASSPQETHARHSERPNSSARSPLKMSSEVPSSMLPDMIIPEKVENILASASESAKKTRSADVSRLGSKSYVKSSPRNHSLSLSSENISSVDKVLVDGDLNMNLETYRDGTDFKVRTPLKRLLDLDEEQTAALPDKSKTTNSRGSSKSPKVNYSPNKLKGSESMVKVSEVSASGSLAYGSSRLAGQISPLSLKEDLNINKTVVLEDGQDCVSNLSGKGMKKRTSLTNSDSRDIFSRRSDCFPAEGEMYRSDAQDIVPKFPTANISRAGRSNSKADSNFSKGANDGPKLKSRKIGLGPKPRISKGSATKLKGSIDLQKVQSENIINSAGAIATDGSDSATMTDTNNLPEFVREAIAENANVDDGNKEPVDKGANDSDGLSNKGKSPEVEVPNSGNMCLDKRVNIDETESKADDVKSSVKKKKVAKSVEKKNGPESETSIPSKKTELTESKSSDDHGEEKVSKGKKRPLTKTKTNKLKVFTEEAGNNECNTKQDEENSVVGADETAALPSKTKKRPSKKSKSSTAVKERENKPALSDNTNTTAVSVAPTAVKKPVNGPVSAKRGEGLKEKTEPAWFILSGHKLQRKEFQQVIKRLKGRVCRDSHNWSYQATHFIVPNPIRRTEKFFAAAASGSWILKTDYLTASNEAGRFLSEEPYEWHKKCLSEDGAINLEAPRKWRLLRERTGHGAFYGMHIVIYGECIAPSLDTLKRAVKAGDGTILATSPPYTRFFQSRIDFAIVSPGMPRVDIWVQEFLRHEVPCISADYLVEYVCKPGYPLERHVQYNTHAWAEKSLKNLVERVEEVEEEDVRTPEGQGVDDVACQVCGSRDGGEDMLICGNESGSLGCGVGTHIECLDPPLEDVPEEDWFCSACSKTRENQTISRTPTRRSSKLKK